MNHKYGFHANRTGDDVLDAIRSIRPKVIKALDHDVGFWKQVRALLPDVFLIGRLAVPQEEQEQFVHDPAATGRAFAERILSLEANRATVQGRKLFDAWESYNEVLPGHAPADVKRAYDDFQVAFAKQKQIFADGFVPNSPEFEIESGGVWYVAQRAEHLGTGEVRVYHVPKGDWAKVAHIQRGEGDAILRA